MAYCNRSDGVTGTNDQCCYQAVKLLFSSILFALVCGLCGCQKPAVAEWIVFAPAGGGFSVLLPSEPQLEAQKAKDGSEPRVYRLYPFLSNVRGMAVGYADQPKGVAGQKDAQKILDESRDVSVADLKGKLLSETSISLGRYAGRELKVAIPNNYVVRVRIYLAGQRKFSLMIVATTKNFDSPEAVKFFDSFQITL